MVTSCLQFSLDDGGVQTADEWLYTQEVRKEVQRIPVS